MIHIPENPEGSQFKNLPDGPAVLMLEKLKAAKSKEGNPMIIATFCVTEEMPTADPNGEPTVGSKISDFYSLKENAIWKVAQDYKSVAGESIPQGDYAETQDLVDVLIPVLEGTMWDAMIVNEEYNGEVRSKIDQKVFKG